MRSLLVLIGNLLGALLAAARGLTALLVRRAPPELVRIELSGALPLLTRRRLLARLASPPVKPRSREELLLILDRVQAATEVRGLVVRVDGAHLGLAAVEEIRERMARLSAAGKEVVFHADQATGKEYELMCSGRVWLAPEGRLGLTGVSAELSTMAAALERAGITAQVVRRGRYKSAAEMVTHEQPSPESREQVGELLDALFAELISAIAAGRGLGRAEVERIVDQGPFSARAARKAKLVDELCWQDELEEKLAAAGKPKARIAPYAALLAAQPEPYRWRALHAPAVARVPILGLIKMGRSRAFPGGLVATGAESAVAALERAARLERVRAVVLHVDSRGGSALASDLIWRAVQKCAAKKPVVAWLEDVAASGGYYVASAATRIVAAPSCITGSIGVFGGKLELSGLLARTGAHRALLTRGANAGMWSWARPFSESERAALEREIGDIYDAFLERVAEGRRFGRQKAEAVAEGRIYSGARARELGLVDDLGGWAEALGAARELARIPAGAELETLDLGRVAGGPLAQLWRGGALSLAEELGGPFFALWPWSVKIA